jgi:hypothetical protein
LKSVAVAGVDVLGVSMDVARAMHLAGIILLITYVEK